MLSTEDGIVENVIWSRKGLQCLEVVLDGEKEKALNYPGFTGSASPGDHVVLNTTAVRLGLGSGGYHFVTANHSTPPLTFAPRGHIIKLRYTPLQLKVHAFEETLDGDDPAGPAWEQYKGLKDIPVVIGELHSMLAPFVLALKKINPARKIAYVMTDSAALPLYLSNAADRLKAARLLEGTVTCGHAFGGDLETINVYTALIAAREVLKADIILLIPGPGVVGTSTRYGYSGIEQGEHVDRVRKFGGLPVVIPRISFSEKRNRHYGLSHHTRTALGEIALCRAYLPLPRLSRKKMLHLLQQMQNSGLLAKHKTAIISRFPGFDRQLELAYSLQSMGRGLAEDPAFFAAVAATASFVERILCFGVK
ncbi:MAG: DUF3866 family protein [Firmicutes bacterium]|nr:DUF3866 family protein [Bacillota bacterium]